MFITDRPMIQEVGYKTYLIHYFGMQSPILFVGEESALLIDAGTGCCDLRGLLEDFVKVPIQVAVTHQHADHVGGIVQFGQVFTPELEIPVIKEYDTKFMQRFLDFFLGYITEPDGMIGCFRSPRQVLSWDTLPELTPVHDGHTFDLGGRTVTAYDCPVHCAGHMVFVDSLSRILYAGDSIGNGAGPANNPINPPTWVSLEQEVRGLEHVNRHRSEFDRIIGGHVGWGGNLSRAVSMEPAIIDRLIAVGKGVLTGELPIRHENAPGCGKRDWAERDGVRLYFFGQLLRDENITEYMDRRG